MAVPMAVCWVAPMAALTAASMAVQLADPKVGPWDFRSADSRVGLLAGLMAAYWAGLSDCCSVDLTAVSMVASMAASMVECLVVPKAGDWVAKKVECSVALSAGCSAGCSVVPSVLHWAASSVDSMAAKMAGWTADCLVDSMVVLMVASMADYSAVTKADPSARS